jgi:sulfur relay (sulfurtransferase) DsrF/TusC family protein
MIIHETTDGITKAKEYLEISTILHKYRYMQSYICLPSLIFWGMYSCDRNEIELAEISTILHKYRYMQSYICLPSLIFWGMYSCDRNEIELADSASISNLTPFSSMASNSNLPMRVQL